MSFLQRLLLGQAAQGPNLPLPMQFPMPMTTAPVAPRTPPDPMIRQAANNPFMVGANSQHPRFTEMYGKNTPLQQDIFLGYRNEKALYGGSRLFILY